MSPLHDHTLLLQDPFSYEHGKRRAEELLVLISISYASYMEIHGYPPQYQASSLYSMPPAILPLPA